MTVPDVEAWVPSDVVLAANGGLWVRAEPHDVAAGWPWAYCTGYAPRKGEDSCTGRRGLRGLPGPPVGAAGPGRSLRRR